MTNQPEKSDPEIEFNVFESKPIRNLRKFNSELDSVMRSFEETHGAKQTELVALMGYGVRHAGSIDARLVLVYELAEALLSQASQHNRKTQAKHAAAVRHAENHAMKANVFDWLDSNFTNYKSMDAAAEAMAGKLVPAKFRAVRGWVTEWKKIRSASKL